MGAKRNRELKAEPNNSYNSQWGNWMIRRHIVDSDEMRDALRGLHDKMLAETVEVDGAALTAIEEGFWDIYEPM